MRKIIWVSIVLLSSFTQLSCSKPQSTNTTKASKIDALVTLFADYAMFNGTILVVDQGKVLYKSAFGSANMAWDVPNTVDTKFQIASLTKGFTAMLVMQLVAENKLDLHHPISTYLADYPKEQGEQITVHHLLTHTAGLAREASNDSKQNRTEAMVQQFSGEPLQFTPGERFQYSNAGYTLLGYLIETVTEQPYETVLQENIFTPLEMENSGYFKHQTVIKQMASGYNKGFGDYFNAQGTDETTAYAAGAIYATVEDLLLWDRALQTQKLLPNKYKDMLFKKHSIDPSYNGHYGYGWEIIQKPIGNTPEKVETVGHSGSIDGFRALYTQIPSRDASIILLSNTNYAFLNSMTTAITGILYDQPYDLPLIPLAKAMLTTMETEGIDAGIQFYKAYKDASKYHASEQELIVAGYKVLEAGDAQTAAKIFKLSTEVFPDRYNPFDSYAEALMTLGKNEEAIVNYKKSLAINPANNNAIAMLKKLGVHYSTDLMNAAASWDKEVFAIPLHFAPDIALKGFEDARFPKGWTDTESPYFWTYSFAWKVNIPDTLTVKEVEVYVQEYYDGLLQSMNKEEGLEVPKTSVALTHNRKSVFKGEATIYDTFTTQQPLLLHLHIEQTLCENTGNSILHFKISPQDYNHTVWDELEQLSLLSTSCE